MLNEVNILLFLILLVTKLEFSCDLIEPMEHANVENHSGISRIFVRGVLSFGLLYDCACVNPKCYPYDFRARRGLHQVVVFFFVVRGGGSADILREYIGLQGKYLRQYLRTCPDRRRVALHVTVGDREAFFTRNSN